MGESRKPPQEQIVPEKKKIKIPVRSLDLSKAWDTPSQAEIVFDALRKIGIDPEKCVYAGFDGKFINLVLNTGTHSKKPGNKKMFCSDCTDLKKEYRHTDPNALDFAFDTKDPALAVYDLKHLNFTGTPNFREYEIRPNTTPEELVRIIYRLK